ncbi:hypothetical protein JVX92_11445 [Microbacterium hominis]|uniref:hypothetical protein n=1 Tax=Microbacterium hominis TaxID=162426 RepID=UPI001963EDAA|nr:hypothetical protein [Microbacterium hominis]QRY40110.1 hypothetical protein JVX92_11445 [Microbacterium hominis]
MRKSTLTTGILAAILFAGGAFGLTGCGAETSTAGGAGGGGSSASQATQSDVTADLESARQAVIDGLEAKPGSTQIMLAGDVKQPTEKYGLLVMPFVKSDAAKRVTGTVNIDGGSYVIEAVSSATGETWQIDQDGTITQAGD